MLPFTVLEFFSIASRKDAAKARDRKNEGIDIKVKLNIYRVNTQYAIRVLLKSVSKVLRKIPKPAAPTLQEDLSQDL